MTGPLADTLGDYERLAREKLTPDVAAYLFGGAGEETTLAANRAAFDVYPLTPRALKRPPRLEIELFGRRLAAPLLVAPIGCQKLFHSHGECGTARAAAAFGLGFVTPHLSTTPMETIAAAGEGAPHWLQLYWRGREATLLLARRGEACGAGAFVLTIDAPVDGPRDRQTRAGFRFPADLQLAHEDAAPSANGDLRQALAAAPDWDDVAWLAGAARAPLLLKGIMHPDDARRALEAGCAGLIVSNHGGRALDGALGALHALPGVVDAVAGRAPVLFDSGVRRGVDVAKALRLGAAATLVGRPIIAALAAAGEAGAAHALRLLIDETLIALTLS